MSSKWPLAAALVLALASPVAALHVPVEFVLDQSQSNLTMDVELSLGLSDDDSTSISGTMEALVDLPSAGALPTATGLTFTGGRVFFDQPLALSFQFLPPLVDIDVDINDVSGLLQTPQPPGTMNLVNPTTGQYDFDLSEHDFTVDQGMFVATGTALGDEIDESFDLSETPFSGAPDPGTLTGSLTVEEIGTHEAGRDFHAELSMPIEIMEVIPFGDEGSSAEATVEVSGMLVAMADFTVPFGLLGDYDNNGRVGAGDYTVWQDSLGSTTDLTADGNGNEVVDLADNTLWKLNYGSTAESGAGSGAGQLSVATVPEPATTTLLLLATVAAGLLRPGRS